MAKLLVLLASVLSRGTVVERYTGQHGISACNKYYAYPRPSLGAVHEGILVYIAIRTLRYLFDHLMASVEVHSMQVVDKLGVVETLGGGRSHVGAGVS